MPKFVTRYVYLFFLVGSVYTCNSQGFSNVWYFGENCGLDFNSGAPLSLNNGQLITQEGCATISDVDGQLLFYTDGINVWNRLHHIMPNGSGLMGHSSSSQAAVIVPKPGSDSIFYIFTTTDLANSAGARYSEVDITLDGGLGAVTLIKNVLLKTPVAEKVTVVRQSNNLDYWVMFHEYGSNKFLAYSLTSAGINAAPVVSSVGAIISGNINQSVGYLKFSPQGDKLVACNYQSSIELFDFNASTGVVSNQTLISGFGANYGAEFSPSGNMLYVTKGANSTSDLYQYSLNAPDVNASEYLLYSHTSSSMIGALQLAVDGKIYLAIENSSHLGVISDPEISGVDCGFSFDGISLGDGVCKVGLPQFIQSFFNVGITYQNTCFGNATVFSLNSSQAVTMANWDFGDGQSLNAINPTHIYTAPGQYTISVTAITPAGTLTKTREVTISDVPTAGAISNQVWCEGQGFVYDLSQNDTVVLAGQSPTTCGVAYFTSQSNAESHLNPIGDNYILPTGSTVLYAKAYNLSNRRCYSISNFTVDLNIKPDANQPTDYIICENLPYDNIEHFDLSSIKTQVLGSQPASQYEISYHSSQADADNDVNPLPLVYTNVEPQETIYIRIEGVNSPFCFSTTSFKVGVVQQPSVNNISHFVVCGDASNNGTAIFNLNQKTSEILGVLPSTAFNVRYYYTSQDAANGTNPIMSPVESTSNYSIYYVVQAFNNSACKATGSFKLIISSIPVANQPKDLKRCDDPSNDGFEIFDLTANTPSILGNQNPTQFSVRYFYSLTDAYTGANPIVENYQNISNPQTVYARIENNFNSNCYDITNFQINVDTLPYAGQAHDLHECSTNSSSDFNLSILNNSLLAGQSPSQYSVNYYSSLHDAELGFSPLSEIYSNVTNPQTIYVRVENKTNDACYAITDFRLIVHEIPVIEMDEIYQLCENDNILIQAPLGFNSYYWSTGEQSSYKNFTEPGEYTLTIGVHQGDIFCQVTKHIKIVKSNVATRIDLITSEWTDNKNTIHVIADGPGIYRYSLDNNTYQDSPIFTNLEDGTYTVYVDDVNGCGVVSKEFYLLNYPRFFTPNSDGLNDFWNIKLAVYEPTLFVSILDRFGKIITSFKGNSQGWDGTYNGQPLPANDYWFIVVRSDGRDFKGHFSLKR